MEKNNVEEIANFDIMKQNYSQIEDLTSTCLCAHCSTNKFNEFSGCLYCLSGKEPKVSENRGCVCKLCPVVKLVSLNMDNFCTYGSIDELETSELNEIERNHFWIKFAEDEARKYWKDLESEDNMSDLED